MAGTEDTLEYVCVWGRCPSCGEPTALDRCPDCGTRTESRQAYGTRVAQRIAQTNEETAPLKPVLISTTDHLPGYDIVEHRGDVVGLLVVSRSALGNLGAGLQAAFGGEVTMYSKLLSDARTEARARMWRHALTVGADAVVGMRLASSTASDSMIEVVAYGTAVTVNRTGAQSGSVSGS